MRVPIAVKLAAALLVPFGTLLSVVIFRDFHRREADARAETQALLAEQVGTLAARLDAELQGAGNIASSVAAFLETAETPTEAKLWKIVRRAVGTNRVVYGCCIAFKPGTYPGKPGLFAPYAHRVIADGTFDPNPSIRNIDISTAYDYTDPKWEWYARPNALGHAVWTEPYFDEGAGNTMMCTYSVPFVRLEDPAPFAGVATVDVRLEDLQGLAKGLWGHSGDDHREVFLITPRGRLISTLDSSMVSESDVFRMAREKNREDLVELAHRMIDGETGSMTIRGIRTPQTMMVSFAKMPTTGCSLGTAIPEQAVLAPVYREMRSELSKSLVQLAMIVAVLIGSLWWVMRPLRKLAAAVGVVARGDLNAEVPAKTYDEFGDLGRAFNSMTASLRSHIEALTRETKARESVESELRIAQQIQQSLLPQTFPPFPDRDEFDLYAMNIPAKTVGGDFYDFFFVRDRLVIVIADVSGKGVPAALLMAVSRTIIRNIAVAARKGEVNDPGEVLDITNRTLAADNQQGMFVTIFLGVYDPATGELQYANGAHVPPLIRSSNGEVRTLKESSGTIVGALPEATYTTLSSRLDPGDAIVLVTDGVTEARPDAEQGKNLFGEARLIEVVRSVPTPTAESMCTAIAAAVESHAHGTRADDLTVMALRRVK